MVNGILECFEGTIRNAQAVINGIANGLWLALLSSSCFVIMLIHCSIERVEASLNDRVRQRDIPAM